MSQSGISEQTKKILIGAAIATATVGVGYFAYKSLSGPKSPSDLAKELENIKAAGNELFKKKDYQGAAGVFTKGIELGESKDDEKGLIAMLYQNRAACREKTGSSAFEILNDCLGALKHDKKYAKAYLRAAKQLHTIGKKQEALTYLLAAFILDDKLNKSNFEFFDQLLSIDENEHRIERLPGIDEIVPAPIALYKIQQWLDTWDLIDMFKKDKVTFTPNAENQDELKYRKALDQINSGEYEQVLQTLTEDVTFPPAQILRAKFLSYSPNPDKALVYLAGIEESLRNTIESTEDAHRKYTLREAFDILKLELFPTYQQLEKYLSEVTNENEKDRRYRLHFFAAVLVYGGCVLDTTAVTQEDTFLADTKNTAHLLKIASECDTLSPHGVMMNTFINMCSTNDYSLLHKMIMEMEEVTTKTPTHFVLVLMAKVYLMTGNGASAEKLLNEAAKIKTRYLIAARNLQTADLHLNKSEAERLKGVSECAHATLAVDEYNHAAYILLLLGSNGPDPSIMRKNYEEASLYIQKAAVFAPPRELLMLKRMLPLMNAKKRAAELLGIY